MAQPRFQMVSLVRRPMGSRSSSERYTAGIGQRGGEAAYVWRLLGGNNRELGRSARQFEVVEECERAIELLRRGFPRGLDPRITLDSGMRGWRWQLLLGRQAVAESSRPFSRQRECRYNLEQFMTKFLDAQLVSERTATLASPSTRATPNLAKECG